MACLGTTNVLQLQGVVRLVQSFGISRQQSHEDVGIAYVYQHVLPQLAEAAWTFRKHHAFERRGEFAEFSFKLLKDSKSYTEVFDEVLAAGQVISNLELTTIVLLLLHVLPDRDDEVIDDVPGVHGHGVVFLVRMRAEEGETIVAVVWVSPDTLGLVVSKQALRIDG